MLVASLFIITGLINVIFPKEYWWILTALITIRWVNLFDYFNLTDASFLKVIVFTVHRWKFWVIWLVVTGLVVKWVFYINDISLGNCLEKWLDIGVRLIFIIYLFDFLFLDVFTYLITVSIENGFAEAPQCLPHFDPVVLCSLQLHQIQNFCYHRVSLWWKEIMQWIGLRPWEIVKALPITLLDTISYFLRLFHGKRVQLLYSFTIEIFQCLSGLLVWYDSNLLICRGP